MNEYNEVIKRFQAIEDELVKLRKQRNYELFNLDENNIPRLRQYSQIISENQAAVSLVEQKVSDVESSVTLLSQYTSMDNVVVVEASDDKTNWDKTRVYYDKTAKIYYYYDGSKWTATASPVTAGIDTAIAKIEAKTAENEAEISLVSKSVTQNTQSITGLETLTGQIDGEITTIKTNLAEVTTKADENETAISLVAKSVIDIESDISGLENANKTINESIAAIQLKADGNASDITLLAQSVSRNASDIIGLQETAGNIDKELTTVKTNLASVETKADNAAASVEIIAQSVTQLETDVDNLSAVNSALISAMAAIKTTAEDAAAAVELVAKSVTKNADDIVDLQTTTGNIDKELTTVKTNLATVETKADDAAASAELAAQSVTELEGDVDSLTKSVASVKATADGASASVSTIVSNIGSNGTVNAASIVAKINAAGSTVQIAADHISLKGKTIALTSDSINISSTYFNVATTGAVNCTSLAVTGGSSTILISGSTTESALMRAMYSVQPNTYAEMRPSGFVATDYTTNGNTVLSGRGMQAAGQTYGYMQTNTLTMNSNVMYSGMTGNNYFQAIAAQLGTGLDSVIVLGNFIVGGGTKNRMEQTEHYGNRLMYALESPTPLYSDFGRASIADDGLCYVFLDPVFYECVDNNYDYCVFVQSESDGDFAVIERTADHFIVQGTPSASFAWMLVVPQKGYSATRTEEIVIPEPEPAQTPDPDNAVYDAVGDEILKEFENQLG